MLITNPQDLWLSLARYDAVRPDPWNPCLNSYRVQLVSSEGSLIDGTPRRIFFPQSINGVFSSLPSRSFSRTHRSETLRTLNTTLWCLANSWIWLWPSSRRAGGPGRARHFVRCAVVTVERVVPLTLYWKLLALHQNDRLPQHRSYCGRESI